jgi:hypothetical protein
MQFAFRQLHTAFISVTSVTLDSTYNLKKGMKNTKADWA